MWPFTKKTVVEEKGLADPDAGLAEIFGIIPSGFAGISVTHDMALRVPAVSAAIRVISEAVAGLDVQIKRIADDGTEVDEPGHPVHALLSGAANDWTSGYELIRDLVIDALTSDKGGVAFVNRVGDGRIAEIIRYRDGVADVDYDQITGEPNFRVEGRRIASDDIIHLRSPFKHSPLTLSKDAIAVAIALERHAARLFGRGARPSGALSFPKGMSEAAIKQAREAWRTTHEGENATGATAILYDGAEFTPFTLNSTDAQFLENRKFAVLEIARAFRVPPTMLYDFERATWANAEQAGYEFLTYTLEPWLKAAEGALRRALFSAEERSTHVVRFDRDDLTRADLSTRAQAINSLIASRVLSPNDGRGWLGMQPREGGDEYLNPNISEGAPDAAA